MKVGVGLRQFCDMAVMLHYAKGDIDMCALRADLQTLGMEKAWRACGSILVDYLALPEEELGYCCGWMWHEIFVRVCRKLYD